MANITVESVKPKIGTLRVKHPVLTETIPVLDVDGNPVLDVDGNPVSTEEPITNFPLPDGTTGPIELYFVGTNSPQWYDFMKEMRKTTKSATDATELFSKISDRSHEMIASLMTGWLDNGAIDAPFSHDEALSLIKNPENFWILEQIYAFLLDQRNFFSATLKA